MKEQYDERIAKYAHQINDTRFDFHGFPRFHAAAYYGDIKSLQGYMQNPKMKELVSKPLRNQCGQNALHVACMGAANLSTVQLLVESGVDINAVDDLGRLPMHIAANAGKIEILKFFISKCLERGSLVRADKNGRTIFHAICMSGSSATDKASETELIASLEFILSGKSGVRTVLLQADNFGITPLQYAKYYGYTDLLNFARDKYKIDISDNKISSLDCTHEAVRVDYYGRLKIQELAFDSRAMEIKDIEARKQEQERCTLEILRMLRNPIPINDPRVGNKQFSNMNALHYALLNGSIDAILAILNDPCTDPLLEDDDGRNALHYAAYRGMPTVLLAVLKHQSVKDNPQTINSTDIFGMTPLHAFVSTSKRNVSADELKNLENIACIKSLLEAGADVFAINNEGRTPAATAAIQYENIGLCEHLVDIMKTRAKTQEDLNKIAIAEYNAKVIQIDDMLAATDKARINTDSTQHKPLTFSGTSAVKRSAPANANEGQSKLRKITTTNKPKG